MNLEILSYQEAPIRVAMRDGEPWFCAADVCKCLGISFSGKTLEKFAAEEKGRYPISTLGGKQELLFVSEAGLYRLIFRSDKPAAAQFQRWVFHEVLPAIRKTGKYAVAAVAPAPVSLRKVSLFEYVKQESLDFPVAVRLGRAVKAAARALCGRDKCGTELYDLDFIEWVRSSLPKPVLTLEDAYAADFEKMVARLLTSSARAVSFPQLVGLCAQNGLFKHLVPIHQQLDWAQKSRLGRHLMKLNGRVAKGIRFDVMRKGRHRLFRAVAAAQSQLEDLKARAA